VAVGAPPPRRVVDYCGWRRRDVELRFAGCSGGHRRPSTGYRGGSRGGGRRGGGLGRRGSVAGMKAEEEDVTKPPQPFLVSSFSTTK
jgi:hypothetical protein